MATQINIKSLFIFLPAILFVFAASLLSFPVKEVHAEDGVTTIVAKEVGSSHWAYLFDDKGHDGYIVLQPLVLAGNTLHSQVAKTLYRLEIIVPQFGGPKKLPKYKKLTYEKAVIDVQGDVTTTRHDELPFHPDQKSGPGLTYLTVAATTDEDDRVPPREVRDYTIILHLTGVVGVLQDGTPVDLGDYKIVFGPQFVFFHFNDFNKMPPIQVSSGGGIMKAPPKSGAENVEGPAPILRSEDVVFVIPSGQDLFQIDEAAFTVPIPAGFFGPGSEPFGGTIICGGENIDAADTIIERKSDIILSSPPSSDTIPIELIQLNLISCQPIVVQNNDGSQQQWDVRIDLSPTAPPPGQMTIRRAHENGGTFDSQLPVLPRFIFTTVAGGDNVELDPGNVFEFSAHDVSWLVCPGTESDFCPGRVVLSETEGAMIILVPVITGISDECDIVDGMPDCNANGIPDECDIDGGKLDCDSNTIPDECDQLDSNLNGCFVEPPSDPIITDPI